MKKLFAVIISLVLAFSVTACSSGNSEESQAVETTTSESNATESTYYIKESMDSVLKHKDFEGIVYLTQNGSVVYQSVSGKDEKGQDLTVDSTMYIGSISKQFCAAAVLMLSEQGKLSLDNTLDTYYPDYSAGKEVTVKNLLSMRSGIPDMVVKTPEAALQVKDVSSDKTEEENVAAIKEWIFNQPLQTEPDTAFEYCNANYFLLSDIVEQVSGENYYDFIRKNIFEPLNMTNSGFISDVKNNSECGLTYDTFAVGEDAIGLTNGAGDMVSNAEDMDKWMTALSSGKIISKESYQAMTTDYSPEISNKYGYGMSGSYDGGWGHSGFIGSYTSFDYINTEYGYNLFIADNTGYMNIESLPSDLLTDLFATLKK